MKKIWKQVLMLHCACLLAIQALAIDGIKTVIKGSVAGTEIKVINIFKREMMRRPAATDTIHAGDQFQLAMNLKTPGFYILSDGEEKLSFTLYLKPGDQIAMKMEDGKLVLSGKGSELNQLLYDINNKYSYDKANLTDLPQLYHNRIKTIENSKNAEVVQRKTLLLGYMQGEYLGRLYGPYIESKGYPTGKGMMEVNTVDLHIRLLPEIVVYPGWDQTVTELMFAKMHAGLLKVRNIRTWIADFGNAIENPKLKTQYMTTLIEHTVSYGDYTAVNEEIKAVLPFIKDPQQLARINNAKSKVPQRIGFYKDTMPRTDFSAFAFQDINGKQVKISDFKGKLIYIDIWTTGCMPCMAEAPYLAKLEADMHGQDVVFLSISCDSNAESWKRTMKQYNLNGPHQLLMNGYNDPFFTKVGRSGVPRFLILAKNGKMIDYNSCKRPSNPLLKIYLNDLLNRAKS